MARTIVIAILVIILLLASFAGILRAQAYRRDNPLSSCPPSLLSSSRDTASRAYFSNQAPNAWGPGERGVGIGPLLSTPTDVTETAFEVLRTCDGGTYSGRSCVDDEDCPLAECVSLDLRCSYQDELDAINVGGKGTTARARLLEEQFVNASGLMWDSLGTIAVCDQSKYVVSTGPAVLRSAELLGEEESAGSIAPAALAVVDTDGSVSNSTCLSLLQPPSSSSSSSSSSSPLCSVPQDCTSYPGCTRTPSRDDGTCVDSRALVQCMVQVRVLPAVSDPNNAPSNNNSSDPSVETVDWTNASSAITSLPWAPDCAASGRVCFSRVVAFVHEQVVEVTSTSVQEQSVCERYQRACTECFCRDSVQDFWWVWLLSASEPYAEVCSERFNKILAQVSLFAVAVLAVVLVNQALRYLLRVLAVFEKHPTMSSKERSIIVKTFLAQTFNTVFVPLLVFARAESLARTQCTSASFDFDPLNPVSTFGGNGMACARKEEQDGRPVCAFGGGACASHIPSSFPILAGEFTDMSPIWYAAVASTVMVTVLIDTAFSLWPIFLELPMQRLSEWLSTRSAVTQRQLNLAMEGPSFELASRYGSLLSVVFVSQMLSGGVPIMHLVAATTCGLTALADRFALLRLYRTPPRYDARFAVLSARLLPLAVGLHLAFAMWQFSAILPAIPVSSLIADYLSSAPDAKCRQGSEAERAQCQWTCSGNMDVRCGFVVGGALEISEAGGGEWGGCRGKSTEGLQFDLAARLFTWPSFPHFLALLLLSVAFLFVHSPLWQLLQKCFRPSEREKVPGPSYPEALKNTARWQGPYNYDICKLPLYEPAFAYMNGDNDPEGGGESHEAVGLVGEHTWMSLEAMEALRESLQTKAARSSIVYNNIFDHDLGPNKTQQVPELGPNRTQQVPGALQSQVVRVVVDGIECAGDGDQDAGRPLSQAQLPQVEQQQQHKKKKKKRELVGQNDRGEDEDEKEEEEGPRGGTGAALGAFDGGSGLVSAAILTTSHRLSNTSSPAVPPLRSPQGEAPVTVVGRRRTSRAGPQVNKGASGALFGSPAT